MPNLSKINYLGTEYDICKDQLDVKANVDGAYESMTVGNAEQLVSTVFTEDSVPYLFRTSGGSIDIGDREYDEIVGGSVVWNQLFDIGTMGAPVASTKSYDPATGVVTVTPTNYSSNSIGFYTTSSQLRTKTNHVYFTSVDINPDYSGLFKFGAENSAKSGQLNAGSYQTLATIAKPNSVDAVVLYLASQDWTTGVYKYKNGKVIDLTTFFGSSTIPDYVYSLEQSTAGSGVAWLKKYFPKLFEYHEYDAGTLKSVEGVESHDMVGFNQWDEKWELGIYNYQNGEPISATGRIRTKNPIPILPNTIYAKTSPSGGFQWMCFYDKQMNYVGFKNAGSGNTEFTTPDNAWYLNTWTETTYGGTYNHDMCINLSWDGERNGEYEPYVKHSYPLDDTLTLRGIPKLDANNSLYYDGDTYEADGTVTRRYGVVDLGTLSFTHEESSGRHKFSAYIADLAFAPNLNTPFLGICSKYRSVSINDSWVDGDISWYGNSINAIAIINNSYTDAASFKTAMSGVMLVYELATPTTESAQPYTTPQIVDDWGTERYITDGVVPVGHETKYAPNLRAKLEMLPDSPNGDGDYIVRQSNGQNAYVPLVIPEELPTAPTTDGTYVLKCTVSGGQAALSWEVEE